MKIDKKVICKTPTPGKKTVNIPLWKYNVISSANLKVVPKQEPGVLFKDLHLLVGKQLSKKQKSELGSLSWHTTTVKLDLEVKRKIKRLPRCSPQQLVKY
jgi:hypothetical protein